MVPSESTARSVRLPVWLVLAVGIAAAQVYPPGGYPGGGYPYPGRGTGIPMPGGRTSKGQPKADPNQPLPNFRGTLKHMDEKTISLELGDNRVMDFKRTGKTKFFKNGDEIKNPDFKPGDQLSVEGPEDAAGYMTAVNVYWEKAAAPSTAAADASESPQHSPDKDKAAGVPDTWAKDAPKPADAPAKDRDPDRPVLRRSTPADAPSAAPGGAPGATTAPAANASAADAPAKPAASAEVQRAAAQDPDDPGRPVLRRGKPADPAREKAAKVPEGPATPAQGEPPVLPVEQATAEATAALRRGGDEGSVPFVTRPGDDLIRKATDAALDFTEGLPAYVCEERMSRYQSESRPARFQFIDNLTMTVVDENGKDRYGDLKINGRPTSKTLEESGGAYSTGEFGTVLIDLFSPATSANFRYQRESRVAGISAKMYDFDVRRENSHWDVKVGSQSYSPAYRGSVWIDPQTGRVLRIEKEGYNLPDSFPVDHVESATDYQYVRLGDARQYLLPVHAENLMCQRGSDICSKIVIDFANYHKYSGESTITFGQPKQ
jgi:hypothetical protein